MHELIEGPTATPRRSRRIAADAAGPARSRRHRDHGRPCARPRQGRRGGNGRRRVACRGALYRRALLGRCRGGRRRGTPAGGTAVGVTVDRAHLADYDRVCGFRLTDRLPATYPHVMGFPLALRLMTAPDFPIPLIGLVHVANRITVHRPITADETLDFTAYAENLRPHDRGRQVDVVLVGSVDGEEVWRGVSTYLGQGAHGRRRRAARPG